VELERAIGELERQLLVHVDSEHGDSGAHEQVLPPWAEWAAEHAVQPARLSAEAARSELEGVAAALGGRVRLPWSVTRSS
jgi:hypothetical protein